jgi:hypothetical protein
MSVFRSLTVIPQTPTPLLDAWRLDVVTSISIQYPGEVFRHPIEAGREGITDGVQIDPPAISVTGLLNDFPLAFEAIATAPDRAARMADLLEKLRAQRKALTIVSSLTGLLTDRWIKDFTVTKSSASGSSLEITMMIEKLNIARLQLVPQQLDQDIRLLGMAVVATSFGS